jgi:glycosyltransferase involved in cell wall biosynthesis
VDFPVLHALGNRFCGDTCAVGKPDIALAVFEDATFSAEDVADARKLYEHFITASQWNHDVLERYGIKSTVLHQGIDDTLFQPSSKQRLFGERLTVFSGGKLEYRKGQDLVIAAFRELLTHEPDALLLTCWQNYWPVGTGWGQPHVRWLPGRTDPWLLTNWLEDHGIPARNQHHLSAIENSELPQYLHSSDVAVFASRAEGGTNLCAMEAMAAGVPTIISGSTGHLDLPADCCVRLLDTSDTPNRDGWKESNIGDMAYMLQKPWLRQALTGWTQAKYAADLLDCITTLEAL